MATKRRNNSNKRKSNRTSNKNKISTRRGGSRKPKRSSYNLKVDQMLNKNINILTKLGKYNSQNKKDPYKRTDGERAISSSLRKLQKRYIPEYYMPNLLGDNKNYRLADFYLPKEEIVIEFLGNWNTNKEHKRRYKQKMAIYYRNGIECIYIFPNQLYNITWILENKIKEIQDIRAGFVKEGEQPKEVEVTKTTGDQVKVKVNIPSSEIIINKLVLLRKISYKIGLPIIVLSAVLFFMKTASFKTSLIIAIVPYLFAILWHLLIYVVVFVEKTVHYFIDLFDHLKDLSGK